MTKYWIDFSGYCCIEADSLEEARIKFYENVQAPTTNTIKPFPEMYPDRDGWGYEFEGGEKVYDIE